MQKNRAFKNYQLPEKFILTEFFANFANFRQRKKNKQTTTKKKKTPLFDMKN